MWCLFALAAALTDAEPLVVVSDRPIAKVRAVRHDDLQRDREAWEKAGYVVVAMGDGLTVVVPEEIAGIKQRKEDLKLLQSLADKLRYGFFIELRHLDAQTREPILRAAEATGGKVERTTGYERVAVRTTVIFKITSGGKSVEVPIDTPARVSSGPAEALLENSFLVTPPKPPTGGAAPNPTVPERPASLEARVFCEIGTPHPERYRLLAEASKAAAEWVDAESAKLDQAVQAALDRLHNYHQERPGGPGQRGSISELPEYTRRQLTSYLDVNWDKLGFASRDEAALFMSNARVEDSTTKAFLGIGTRRSGGETTVSFHEIGRTRN